MARWSPAQGGALHQEPIMPKSTSHHGLSAFLRLDIDDFILPALQSAMLSPEVPSVRLDQKLLTHHRVRLSVSGLSEFRFHELVLPDLSKFFHRLNWPPFKLGCVLARF